MEWQDHRKISLNGILASHRLTRRRLPLSCETCRGRKLKCNREKPCQNCKTRGEAASKACSYAEKVEKKHASSKNLRSNSEDMRQRLNRLESSILSILSEKTQPTKVLSLDVSTGPEIEASNRAEGQVPDHDERSPHWETILNELGTMKEAWSIENNQIEYVSEAEYLTPGSHRPGLFAGLTPPPDHQLILASIPPKDTSENLLQQFFGSYNPAIPTRYVLHEPTFRIQHEQHWVNPSQSKIMWIGLLFAIYTTAVQSYINTQTVPSEYKGTAPAVKELYRLKTIQCLLLADISKPADLMIETLYLHSFSEYIEQDGNNSNISHLCGLMMRLALQQGYHRDPTHYPKLSVFQGEMRRRIWSAVSQHEIFCSVPLGLPRAIRYAEIDARPLLNVHEGELYEDMTVLPSERPLSEDTQVSYQVIMELIMQCYGRVLEFLNITQPQPYEEVLKLGKSLSEIYAIIPEHLKIGPLLGMGFDVPCRVMETFLLDMLYHKAICILHRNFWYVAPTDVNIPQHSRKACIDSALILLGHQNSMHAACTSGSCMMPFKWYHYSLINQDFLLAVIILSLDLMSSPHDNTLGNTKLEALERSLNIWTEIVDESRDANHAVKILTSLLQKIKMQRSGVTVPKFCHEPNMMDGSFSEVPTQTISHTPVLDPFSTYPLAPQPAGIQSSLKKDLLPQNNLMDWLGTNAASPYAFNWGNWDQLMTGPGRGEDGKLLRDPLIEFQYSQVKALNKGRFRFPFVQGWIAEE